jgi:acyl-ACP thioesterase
VVNIQANNNVNNEIYFSVLYLVLKQEMMIYKNQLTYVA